MARVNVALLCALLALLPCLALAYTRPVGTAGDLGTVRFDFFPTKTRVETGWEM
jgi:hypothetical protein|tara:strand:- start:493 stop:654 length:162 start_codon:yes stop_codon:yes gene_type:complete